METTDGTRRFWADNAALGLATVVAGLFNSAYSILLAHALGPANYGRVGALNNLVSLFLLPMPIVSLAAIRIGKQTGRSRWLEWGSLGLGILLFGAAVLLGPYLSRRFALSPVLVTLYLSSIILDFGYALYLGYLKRARRYAVVGFLLALASLTGLLSVVLAITAGRQAPLAWLGIWQFTFMGVLFLLTRAFSRRVPHLPPTYVRREVVATTLGVGTLQALWGFSDVLFAKAHLSTVQAGLYTGLSTIGQAFPFVIASLCTVMLTAILDEPGKRRAYLSRTLWATLILGVLFIGVLLWIPDPVVRLALGSAFVPMSALVQRYSDAMAAMALILVFTTYGVANGTYRTMMAAAVGTVGWLVSLITAHSMAALVNRTLIGMVASLVLVVLVFVVRRANETSLVDHR